MLNRFRCISYSIFYWVILAALARDCSVPASAGRKYSLMGVWILALKVAKLLVHEAYDGDRITLAYDCGDVTVGEC